MADDNRRPYIHQALKQFGIDTEQSLEYLARYYVEVPAVWARGSWNQEQGKMIATPFELLVPSASEAVYPLSTPYITMVIGPSGVGKTEFIRQLCRVCAAAPPETPKSLPLRVLPIRLVDCAWNLVAGDRKPSPEQFRDSLFSRLLLMDDSILSDISEGSLLLALDGLDEVVRKRAEHNVFFECLNEMLAPHHLGGRYRIRVVVTCRVKYLEELGVGGAQDILPHFAARVFEAGASESEWGERPTDDDRWNRDAARLAEQTAVHFLRLDFFNPARIKKYLGARKLESLAKYVKPDPPESHAVGEIMQRPLFLKLLCDVAQSKPGKEALEVQNIADVMNRLADSAAANVDSAWAWDNDALARAALGIFKERRSGFDSEAEVAPVIRKRGQRGPVAEPPADLFEAIHKCPFLRREGSGLRFTHQIFFQYFVARGMFLSLQESEAREGGGLADFDRFVLTVEMRQFLREMLGNAVWMERTRKSFALDADSLGEWPKPEWAQERYAQLENIRTQLLRYMTAPEQKPDSEERKALGDFLELNLNASLLHARYLLCCHEGVAIYVGEHRWGREGIETEFENRIRKDLEAAIRTLKRGGHPPQYVDDLGRLVLRILDIGYRLRFPTVLRWAEREAQLKVIRGDTSVQLKKLREQVQACAPPKRKAER
jgi:hypothetical protein